jgi:hypothetical protein
MLNNKELQIMAQALPIIDAVPEEQDACWPSDGPVHDDWCKLTDHAASHAAVEATVGVTWDFYSWSSTARTWRDMLAGGL